MEQQSHNLQRQILPQTDERKPYSQAVTSHSNRPGGVQTKTNQKRQQMHRIATVGKNSLRRSSVQFPSKTFPIRLHFPVHCSVFSTSKDGDITTLSSQPIPMLHQSQDRITFPLHPVSSQNYTCHNMFALLLNI